MVDLTLKLARNNIHSPGRYSDVPCTVNFTGVNLHDSNAKEMVLSKEKSAWWPGGAYAHE